MREVDESASIDELVQLATQLKKEHDMEFDKVEALKKERRQCKERLKQIEEYLGTSAFNYPMSMEQDLRAVEQRIGELYCEQAKLPKEG